jgi:hypothetical protein
MTVALACAPSPSALAQEQPIPDDQLEQEENRACADDPEADACEQQEAEAEEQEADGAEAPTSGGESKATPRAATGGGPKITKVRVLQVTGGKKITYHLNENADVTLVFDRCASFKGLKCTKWKRAGTRIDQNGYKGGNSTLVGSRSLPAGLYVVTVHGLGTHGHSNMPEARFRIRR